MGLKVRSLKAKLLILLLPLGLIPLLLISSLSYYLAQSRITEDRVVLYLKEISQGLADTIYLTLLEKKEGTIAMSLTVEFQEFLLGGDASSALEKLDRLVLVHEVYDLLILFDVEGRALLLSSVDRNKEYTKLPADSLSRIIGVDLEEFVPGRWLHRVRGGKFGFIDWHRSELVQQVYNYRGDDIALQYDIGFVSPIYDDRGVVIGGIMSLMNWMVIQEILDRVQERLEEKSLVSGYAFLFGEDRNTIIGHKDRLNRHGPNGLPIQSNNYGTRLREEHGLNDLQAAVASDASSFEYQYPPGVDKISGLAGIFSGETFFREAIQNTGFNWVCGVGINHNDIFAPVYELAQSLIVAVLLFSLVIVFITFSIARQISVPVKELTIGAARISGGDLSERVAVKSRDEIGEMAQTFNEMAASLEERSQALLDLNRSLEEKVKERTHALEESNREVRKAYHELKETQVQLIQSEKMASLGQLVAGIAHEIKNPLNFIYGNTEFLKQYVDSLKGLIEFLEERLEARPELRRELESHKKRINYDFLLEDVDTLIRNFDEGAERIHAIIGDLRTFSRMDTDQMRAVDIQEPIDLALNLLRNQYRDRIRIHKAFDDLPLVECDPGKISQVMMNLLVNACHAISGEGDIWIRTACHNGRVVVRVEDNGQGISKENLGKIFEPFFTTKPVGMGTGLGLSISYGIIQQHRGSIRVESEVGKGSTFTVELPVKG